MKQICAFAIIICFFVVLALPAFGAERYFGLSGGAWLPGKKESVDANFSPVKVNYKTGWSAGWTFGVALDSRLHLENELVYRQAKTKGLSGDQCALGWLVNVWWDASQE